MQSTTTNVTLQIGSQGAKVRELQMLLNQRVSRDYAVIVDGIFGPKTAATVKICQRIYFLTEDGIVGPRTWKALQADQPVDMPILRRGSKGELVKRVQEVLNEGTTFNLVLDGDFGPKTEAAVKEFQKGRLVADGMIGPQTWKALSGKVSFFIFD